jgi:hypothetical protein
VLPLTVQITLGAVPAVQFSPPLGEVSATAVPDCPDWAIEKTCPAMFMFADRPLLVVFAVIE